MQHSLRGDSLRELAERELALALVAVEPVASPPQSGKEPQGNLPGLRKLAEEVPSRDDSLLPARGQFADILGSGPPVPPVHPGPSAHVPSDNKHAAAFSNRPKPRKEEPTSSSLHAAGQLVKRQKDDRSLASFLRGSPLFCYLERKGEHNDAENAEHEGGKSALPTGRRLQKFLAKILQRLVGKRLAVQNDGCRELLLGEVMERCVGEAAI